MSAATLAALASCTQQIENPAESEGAPQEGVVTTLVASFDGNDTKTVLNEETMYPEWEVKEKITVYNGDKSVDFINNETERKSIAEFIYDGLNYSLGEKMLAVSPAGTYTFNLDNKTVSGIYVPETQYVVANTYPSNAAVAVAYSEDINLGFKNALALLKFTVKDEGVKSGAFYGNKEGNDKAISGTFSLTLGEDNVPALTSTDKKHWVDFKVDDNGTAFTKDKTYYIAIAPQTLEEGFSIKLGSDVVAKYDASFTFERNQIYDLGPLVTKKDWTLTGSMNSWNDTEMAYEGSYYVARNIPIFTTDGFKFRRDRAWNVSVGGEMSDMSEFCNMGGQNITVKESANYDVYLFRDASKVKLVKVGDYSDNGDRTLYLKVNSNWTQLDNNANPWFSAYFFEGTKTSGATWVAMTKVENESNTYKVTVPSGDYTKVIFCRMRDGGNNNWSTKMNQTGNLTVPTGNNNLYTVPDGTWDNSDNNNWSEKQ